MFLGVLWERPYHFSTTCRLQEGSSNARYASLLFTFPHTHTNVCAQVRFKSYKEKFSSNSQRELVASYLTPLDDPKEEENENEPIVQSSVDVAKLSRAWKTAWVQSTSYKVILESKISFVFVFKIENRSTFFFSTIRKRKKTFRARDNWQKSPY